MRKIVRHILNVDIIDGLISNSHQLKLKKNEILILLNYENFAVLFAFVVLYIFFLYFLMFFYVSLMVFLRFLVFLVFHVLVTAMVRHPRTEPLPTPELLSLH